MFSSSSENENVEELVYSHISVNQESGKAQAYLRNHIGDLEAFEIGLVFQKIEGDSLGAGITWVGFVDNALWIHKEGMQAMINERHIGTRGYEGNTVEAIQHFVNYLERFPVVKRLLS